MNVSWPEDFDQVLAWINWIKGDIVSYLNIKCAVAMDLYVEFTVAMLILPVATVLGLASYRLQSWWQQRPQGASQAPTEAETDLSQRLGGGVTEPEVQHDPNKPHLSATSGVPLASRWPLLPTSSN